MNTGKARQRRGEKKVEWLEAERLEGRPGSEDLQVACPSASKFLLFTSRREILHVDCQLTGRHLGGRGFKVGASR